MDFGDAVRALKSGERVSRTGWNGKGMWLALKPGHPDGAPITSSTALATGIREGTVCRFLPYIVMKTAAGELPAMDTFVPWLASQTDVLAEDWEVKS